RIITATTRMYQQYSGMRRVQMPGERHFRTPTISSTAAAMEAISMKLRPRSQMSFPTPGCPVVDSGGYMNQPPFGAASKKIDPQTKTPPSTKHQNPNADRRGNGRSRAA